MRHLVTEPSELSAPFWAAAAEHRLVAPRCNATGRYFFPPERCVPGTASTDWEYADSAGTGTVYTYTVVYRPVSPDFEAPYVIAVVDIDEGWTMMTNIVDCGPEDVQVGMRVRVTYLDIDGGALPVFRPAF
ncbi:protein of unknown function DUF35 [Mycolicibacterium rhodesiae JS60]|nr:protein of unknown function DUF35 [Mycolicibacterium rhodesiae JS60]